MAMPYDCYGSNSELRLHWSMLAKTVRIKNYFRTLIIVNIKQQHCLWIALRSITWIKCCKLFSTELRKHKVSSWSEDDVVCLFCVDRKKSVPVTSLLEILLNSTYIFTFFSVGLNCVQLKEKKDHFHFIVLKFLLFQTCKKRSMWRKPMQAASLKA